VSNNQGWWCCECVNIKQGKTERGKAYNRTKQNMCCRLENQSIAQYAMATFSEFSEYCIFHAKDLKPQNYAPFTFIRRLFKGLMCTGDDLIFISVCSKKSPSGIFNTAGLCHFSTGCVCGQTCIAK